MDDNVIDRGHEAYNPYLSMCPHCIHFDSYLVCPAFPDGIPEIYLSGEDDHLKVDKNQTGTSVFTENKADPVPDGFMALKKRWFSKKKP